MSYKDTLNLPKTDFPMKANLPQREPEMLKRWKETDIYARILQRHKHHKARYVLHDGPPYSNGHIHMGHVLNKVLKDIVVKFHTMIGNYVPFVPGWDCHGLPVEHQLMKDLKIEKGDIPQVEFRQKAKDFALKFVDIQRTEFERLGIFGDWNNPYLTLHPHYEASIVRSYARLVEQGFIYKDLKPVNWCYRCETALAEAEVEYETHSSPSVFVKFKIATLAKLREVLGSAATRISDDTYVVIWTTTPWTLVANVAIALSPTLKYAIIRKGEQSFILAEDLLPSLSRKLGLDDIETIAAVKGKDLEDIECLHPFIDRRSKIVLADYVSCEEGTGCVHTAPGHGQEDYLTGKKYGLPTIMPVDTKGRFDESAGELKGLHVFDANKTIIEKLKKSAALMYAEKTSHSYPHCWRCKNPIIFRATSQYFMKVDHRNLRRRVQEVIRDKVTWMPETGRERIMAMIENRPDWCLSRQRLWGVPIVAFYCAECGELLLDKDIINHVADVFEKEGSNAWFVRETSQLLPQGIKCKKCKNDTFTKETDILDVWFESGVSHQAVLKPRGEYPADLYLEGSDQHRGWFQSALLSSMGIDDTAPYKAVLTHGFVVDGEGKKMSKSLGNVISPEEVMKKYGADILRIWVASCDYRDDVRLSPEILARLSEAYRKIRNTCRYILGNLGDFDPSRNAVGIEKWSYIDKWALWRISVLLETAENHCRNFTFHKAFNAIYNFCVVDMSSVYLDVLKDTLYVAGKNSILRRGAQSALFEIITLLARIMAPILVYTAEEIWKSIPLTEKESVHLQDWPESSKIKAKVSRVFGEDDMSKWNEKLLPLRDCVLKELENVRAKNVIGSSLDAKISLCTENREWRNTLKDVADILKSFFIVSDVELIDAAPEDYKKAETIPVYIKVVKAGGRKCQRCWNYDKNVGHNSKHPDLCARCADIVEEIRIGRQ